MIAVLCFGCLFVTINQPLPASSHVCTSYTHQIITANSHLTHLHVLSLTKTRLGNRSFVLASPWLWNNVSSFVAFGERLYVLAGVCCKHICLTEATAHSDIFAFRCCVQTFLLTYRCGWACVVQTAKWAVENVPCFHCKQQSPHSSQLMVRDSDVVSVSVQFCTLWEECSVHNGSWFAEVSPV